MYATLFKRIVDICFALLLLPFLSPIMAVVAIAIRVNDGGPAIFRQKRVGANTKLFVLLKFRSMPINAPNVSKTQAGRIQVTKIGAILRRTNLDELPQLFNVLNGDMSFIGPRPCLPAQSELYQMRLNGGVFNCRPGLTGLAQVNAFTGMPDSQKAEWDTLYCRDICFLSDLKIFFRTFAYFLKPPPVY